MRILNHEFDLYDVLQIEEYFVSLNMMWFGIIVVVFGITIYHSDLNVYGSNGMGILSFSLSILVAMNSMVTSSS